MTNAMNNLRAFEANLVCVKAMIFEKKLETGFRIYATVLCTVPNEDYGDAKIRIDKAGRRPTSHGTFIRAQGRGLMTPAYATSLTAYEQYLKKEGWAFVTTVTTARGKTQKESFSACLSVIRAIQVLRGKI